MKLSRVVLNSTKKKVLEYLEARGFFQKMDSYIEGTLADFILSKKNETNDYWLEAKATTISLGDADFLSEIGKYLVAYLTRSPQNRFRMLIVAQGYRNKEEFKKVYEEIDETEPRRNPVKRSSGDASQNHHRPLAPAFGARAN